MNYVLYTHSNLLTATAIPNNQRSCCTNNGSSSANSSICFTSCASIGIPPGLKTPRLTNQAAELNSDQIFDILQLYLFPDSEGSTSTMTFPWTGYHKILVSIFSFLLSMYLQTYDIIYFRPMPIRTPPGLPPHRHMPTSGEDLDLLKWNLRLLSLSIDKCRSARESRCVH